MLCLLHLRNIFKKLEENKGVVSSRKLKTDRQYNDQKKKDDRTNNDLQNTTKKTYDPVTRTSLKTVGDIRVRWWVIDVWQLYQDYHLNKNVYNSYNELTPSYPKCIVWKHDSQYQDENSSHQLWWRCGQKSTSSLDHSTTSGLYKT